MNTRNYLIDTSVENANYPDRDEELFDMVDSMATLIQSCVRGFLVRKKVLRYITLAIYYQSFCDKIQDVLCIHVRNYVLNILKNKLNNMKNKYGANKSNININNKRTNNQRNNDEYGSKIHSSKSFYKSVKTEGSYNNNNYRIPNIKNNNNNYNTNYIRKEYNEYNINRNTPIKGLRKDYSDIYETRKITNIKKLRKDNSYQYNLTSNFNRSYHRHKKSEISQSPSSRVIHYFVNSPCTNKAPHHRYYHEINKKTESVKHYGENQLNNHRTCHKCDEIRRMKKQEKFYITTTTEKREEEDKRIYEYENMKYNQSSENIYTHKKDIENDNYLSLNILKLQDKNSVSTRDIFTSTTKDPNKISKVESINIKKTKNQKTEKEIEEEINRRVKITILEREKIEKERKIK